jgi:hypothetical protein
MQSDMYASTRSCIDFDDLLKRRLAYWNVGETTTLSLSHKVDCIKILRMLFASLHYTVGMAALRTICNAWNTTARFHAEMMQCCFCGRGTDSIPHFACCPVIENFFASINDAVLSLSEKDDLAFFIGLPPFLEEAAILQHGILVAAALAAHQSLAKDRWRGREHADATLAACVNALARKDARCRRILISAMRPPIVVVTDDCSLPGLMQCREKRGQSK